MKRAFASLDYLRPFAATNDAVLVAYSGGKDSVAVADLCCRTFKRVEAFMWCLLPGLEFYDRLAADARARFGFTVKRYPGCFVAMRDGMYCDSPTARDEWPVPSVTDIYRIARADFKIDLVADGCRKQDSPRRRQLITKKRLPRWNLTPIGDWITYEVKAYLAARKIPLPEAPSHKKNAVSTGLSLSHDSLIWLHDTYPDDFNTLLRVFPYAEAVIKRREFYGPG